MPNVSNVKSKFFGAVDALDADGISVAASIGSATTLTLGGTLTSGGSYTSGDNIGQLVTILSAGDDSGITFTVVGTDAVGDAQTEVVTGADTGTATSSGYFNTVASITTSGASAGNVSAGVTGTGTGTIFAGRTRVRGLQGLSAATAGNLLFKNTSVTGTTLMTIPTSTSTTDLIEPYIPDNAVLLDAGAYVSFAAGLAAGVTVFYDGQGQMANTTSGSYTFEKTLSIDEIIEDAYERIGLQNVSGYQLRTAKRSLNILFSEWGNRGLHYWEVANQSLRLVEDQSVYNFYRTAADGTSDGISTTLTAGINASVTSVPVASVAQLPASGTIIIGSEEITYAAISSLNLTGCVRGVNGTTAATHSGDDAVLQFIRGMDEILEANYRIASTNVDAPMTQINRSQYQAFSNKTDTGTPTQYWVQRFIDRTTLTIYLTPGSTQAANYINFYYTRRIQDVGDAYTNATNVPYRFVPCMVSGLAFLLAKKNPTTPQKVQEMKLLYEDELARALSEDGSSTSTYIAPKVYFPGV